MKDKEQLKDELLEYLLEAFHWDNEGYKNTKYIVFEFAKNMCELQKQECAKHIPSYMIDNILIDSKNVCNDL